MEPEPVMERCNVCNKEVEDVEKHISDKEHLANLEKIKNTFKSKVYQNSKRGIDV